jgi:two-component system response regulator DesR
MRGIPIRVVVHHRLTLSRDAVATALELVPDIEVVGTVDSLSDAAAVCRRERPDVVVVDLGADPNASLAGIAEISATCEGTRVVCIVGPIDAAGIVAAEQVGVDHLVSATVGIDALIEAIRGRQPFAVKHFVHVDRVADGRQVQALTRRERQVLERVAAGESRTTIARALGISAKTVDNHKRNFVVKLGATNQAHAVSVALKRGLLPRDAVGSTPGVPVPGAARPPAGADS